MPLVSVTRFRSRSIRFLPLFAFHASWAIGQLRKADGYLAGAIKRDRDFSLWTMSVWRDESAMRVYFASGAHGKAMPHLLDWGVEASVVRWVQAGVGLPDWSHAVQQMRDAGRASKLRHPGPHHADLSYAEPVAAFTQQL
jgi:hypothetical protein